MTNLLGNAVKYSPDGGAIELRIERAQDAAPATRLEMRRRTPEVSASWVHLTVRDEGIGLPASEEEREALFEPFNRGENAPAERFSGFGLGLYICAEIVRRHGGTIWAESAGPYQGTTFHVALPPSPPGFVAPVPSETETSGSMDGGPAARREAPDAVAPRSAAGTPPE